jgi:broad specificity phosphatase PhoE
MKHPPPSDTTWLLLIRHGATPANERQPPILQGCGIDLPLSATGERQAAALARFLSDFPIRHVYSSPLLRARMTAQAIAGPHSLDAAVVEGVGECNVGQWEGLDWGTIRERFPNEAGLFHDNPFENPYLGGESYGDVYRRSRPVIEGLLERHRGETVVLVAHNVVNRVYLAEVLGLGGRRAPTIRQQNACINLIVRDARGIAVNTLNAVFHLDEAPL